MTGLKPLIEKKFSEISIFLLIIFELCYIIYIISYVLCPCKGDCIIRLLMLMRGSGTEIDMKKWFIVHNGNIEALKLVFAAVSEYIVISCISQNELTEEIKKSGCLTHQCVNPGLATSSSFRKPLL